VLLFLFLLLVHTFLPDTLSCLFCIFFSSSIGNLMLGNQAIHVSKKNSPVRSPFNASNLLNWEHIPQQPDHPHWERRFGPSDLHEASLIFLYRCPTVTVHVLSFHTPAGTQSLSSSLPWGICWFMWYIPHFLWSDVLGILSFAITAPPHTHTYLACDENFVSLALAYGLMLIRLWGTGHVMLFT
jgi:hypothetical protein